MLKKEWSEDFVSKHKYRQVTPNNMFLLDAVRSYTRNMVKVEFEQVICFISKVQSLEDTIYVILVSSGYPPKEAFTSLNEGIRLLQCQNNPRKFHSPSLEDRGKQMSNNRGDTAKDEKAFMFAFKKLQEIDAYLKENCPQTQMPIDATDGALVEMARNAILDPHMSKTKGRRKDDHKRKTARLMGGLER
ncbi:hypothetical protein GIB67_029735 [Kingdonia uniflora]|uniref:Uncharacterized protein n=1 Tax=Kingdonia uniflora TaxID=39325 RepID=A0A7J7LLN8_9MAGN|nr:hypothetical protein GIB67_029735 [Kingdonia uniflora]